MEEEEIDLKELFDMFWKKKLLIILVVILFAIAGAFYTLNFITPTYVSTTRLVLVQTGAESTEGTDLSKITTTDLTINDKLVDNYCSICDSDSVMEQVIKNLNLDLSVTELKKIVTVSVVTDTELIKIDVEYTNADTACKIANEISNVFIEKVNNIYNLDNLHVLDVPKVATEPSNINIPKNVVIFAFIGAVLSCGYILLINMLDTTIKTDKDIEKVCGLTVLGQITLSSDNPKKRSSSSSSRTEASRTEVVDDSSSPMDKTFYKMNFGDNENGELEFTSSSYSKNYARNNNTKRHNSFNSNYKEVK